MFEHITCAIFGHTDDYDEQYHWDVPLHPSIIDDECMRDGFVSCKWECCSRCGALIDSTPVPTEEAPSPVKTAPLIPDSVAEEYA